MSSLFSQTRSSLKVKTLPINASAGSSYTSLVKILNSVGSVKPLRPSKAPLRGFDRPAQNVLTTSLIKTKFVLNHRVTKQMSCSYFSVGKSSSADLNYTMSVLAVSPDKLSNPSISDPRIVSVNPNFLNCLSLITHKPLQTPFAGNSLYFSLLPFFKLKQAPKLSRVSSFKALSLNLLKSSENTAASLGLNSYALSYLISLKTCFSFSSKKSLNFIFYKTILTPSLSVNLLSSEAKETVALKASSKAVVVS
jgi:hypothetical protein